MNIEDVRSLLNYSEADLKKFYTAYEYAEKKHDGQFRASGEPYMSHPIAVAYILAQMNMDIDTVISGLLHDTIEDTDATREDITGMFGDGIAFLVDGLTKIDKITFNSKEEKQAENFRKMLLSMSEDVRVIIIKLADRLHNIRTLGSLRPDKQVRIAEETLSIYAPLADRLGIAWMKWELEDTCFRIIKPAEYDDIQKKVVLNRTDRERYIRKVTQIISNAIEKEGLDADIAGRPKHFYSIYMKMMKKHTAFEDIYDLIALRLIVNTVTQCYAVMGVIHSLFKPVPNRFKDYIAMPKANMYQSLHTTVVGPDGQLVEFQIRTYDMHKVAEEGIAAHWKYKEGKAFDPKSDQQFVWLRQLVEQKDKKSTEIVETLVEDVLQSQIYVFTPNGDVIELPEGATPLDFAYAIHSAVGEKCVGAKVDGRIVNLKYRLHNGQVIEIVTSPNQEPRKDWLNVVKTTRAKTRIRAYLRKKDSERAITRGMDALEKDFKEHGENFKEILDKPALLAKLLDKLNFKNSEELLTSVGFGMITPRKVLHSAHPHLTAKEEDDDTTIHKPQTQTDDPFVIDGIDNILVKIARCCTPLPGDDIVGYISIGRGILIHKRDCKNLQDAAINKDRIIPVQWNEKDGYRAPVKFVASTQNRPGLINAITAVVKDMGLNIIEYSSKAINQTESEQRFSVEVKNAEEATTLFNKLQQVKGVNILKKV